MRSISRVLEIVSAAVDVQDDTEYDTEYQTLVKSALRFGTVAYRNKGVHVQYQGHSIEVVPAPRNKYTIYVDRSASLVSRDHINFMLRQIKQEIDQKPEKGTGVRTVFDRVQA